MNNQTTNTDHRHMKDRSYCELCFNIDGQESVYLRVPTVWDEINKEWIGFIKTPETKMLITGKGKDSFELQNDMIKAISYILQMEGPISEEVFGMFMPAWFWEKE